MSDETPPVLPSCAEVKKNWTKCRSYQASIRWPVDGRVPLGNVVGTTASVEASLPPLPRVLLSEGHLQSRRRVPNPDGADG